MPEHEGETIHSSEQVRSAIESLETIVEQKPTLLRRIVDLGHRFMAACLPSAVSHDPQQERLLDAIAVIKAHCLTKEAPAVPAAIRESADSERPSGSKTLAQIAISASAASSRKVAALRAPWRVADVSQNEATPRELDFFRVKAIALIRKYVTKSTSLREALEAIRNTPILQTSDSSSQGMITLQQRIQLFPDYFVLEGSFVRNAHSKVTSIPLADSFYVTSCFQTGHPLPMQHNGWALGESLRWPSMHRPHLPTVWSLLEEKHRLTRELSSGGPLALQAKNLISLKQQAFHARRSDCLRLHQVLAQRIVGASPQVDAYFSWLSDRSDAYEQLSQLYETINEAFLPKEGQVEATRVADWLAAQRSHPARDFLAVIGAAIDKGSQAPHTLLGRQLLHAFYHQLWSFVDELQTVHTSDEVGNRLIATLEYDIQCLETDPLEEEPSTVPHQATVEILSAL